jgi:FtsP/CotA-like multicopper oxidase with cupredoxin domain
MNQRVILKEGTMTTVANRRTFLQVVALGGLASLLQGCTSPVPGGQNAARTIPASGGPAVSSPAAEITVTASKGSMQILPGTATTTWGYHAEVVQGDAGAVQTVPDSYLGPILRLRHGQKVRINLKNELDEATIIHWHGLLTPPEMDGRPQDAVGPGKTYVYEFEMKNRAGTYWFHPHPHERTGYQAYMGLAGLLLVSDEQEAALALPTGAYDVPLVIQDRTFDTDNQLVYLAGEMPGMGSMGGMEQTMGFLGERILVNGRPDFVLPVATRVYRLRLLNGANSRIYKLAWSNGAPLTVIASDGGLLEQPVQRPYVTLAPGERVEVWADFSQLPVGELVKLQSLAFTGVEAGMFMGGMRMEMADTATLPNGAPFDVLTVRVERAEPESLVLPANLAPMQRLHPEEAANASQPRPFALGMTGGVWTINGKSFVMGEVDESETVLLGSVELWELINELNMDSMGRGSQGHMGHSQMGGQGSMQSDAVDFMAHPMHLHGAQFQVISRQIDPAYEQAWRSVSEGFVDEGWKDTVLVMPGERVRIAMRFADYAGLYLVHCHNLEHESAGMMRNYLIEERA